jgi:hypothetical protein
MGQGFSSGEAQEDPRANVLEETEEKKSEEETLKEVFPCSLLPGNTAVNFMILYNKQVVGIEAGSGESSNTYNYPFTLFIRNEAIKDPSEDEKVALCQRIAKAFKDTFAHANVEIDTKQFVEQLSIFATATSLTEVRAKILMSQTKGTDTKPSIVKLVDAGETGANTIDDSRSMLVQPVAFIRTADLERKAEEKAHSNKVNQVAVVVLEVKSIKTVVQILKQAMLGEIEAAKESESSKKDFWRTPWLSKILKEEAPDNPIESLINLNLRFRNLHKISANIMKNSSISGGPLAEEVAYVITHPGEDIKNLGAKQDLIIRGSYALGMLAGAENELLFKERLTDKTTNAIVRYIKHVKGRKSNTKFILNVVGAAALTGGAIFTIWKKLKPMLMRMADGSVQEIQNARKELVVTNKRSTGAILHAQKHPWASDAEKADYLMDILINLQEDISMSIGEGAELADVDDDEIADLTEAEREKIFAPSLAANLQEQIALLDISNQGITSGGKPLDAQNVAKNMMKKIIKSAPPMLQTPAEMLM